MILVPCSLGLLKSRLVLRPFTFGEGLVVIEDSLDELFITSRLEVLPVLHLRILLMRLLKAGRETGCP